MGRFPLVYAVLALGVAIVGAVAVWYPVPSSRPHVERAVQSQPPRTRWGHVDAYAGAMVVTLGPAGDRRHRQEFVFDRIEFVSAGISISNDSGRTFHPLGGSPMVDCGFHWQGWGLNAIVATQRCVPSWAIGSSGRTGREWLRLENLVPYARVVLVRFSPSRGRLDSLLTS